MLELEFELEFGVALGLDLGAVVLGCWDPVTWPMGFDALPTSLGLGGVFFFKFSALVSLTYIETRSFFSSMLGLSGSEA